MNKEADLNWGNRSDDWRKGWKYGQGDDSVCPNPDSEEFCAGYRYAIIHPFGSCYSINATTGK